MLSMIAMISLDFDADFEATVNVGFESTFNCYPVVPVATFNRHASLRGHLVSGMTHPVQKCSCAEAFCHGIAIYVVAMDSFKLSTCAITRGVGSLGLFFSWVWIANRGKGDRGLGLGVRDGLS